MKNFLEQIGLETRNGQFQLADNIRRVKLDVGLSVNAPQSAKWLEADPDLFVLGFEPLLKSVEVIQEGSSDYERRLTPSILGSRMAILRIALSSVTHDKPQKIFVTKNDPGCSSLLEPKTFEIDRIEEVPVYCLDEILEFFPFDRIPIIDHLKIDAQGSDFEILKGVEFNIKRFFAITVELDTDEYLGSTNDVNSVESFLAGHGFRRFHGNFLAHLKLLAKGYKLDIETDDPTFINMDKIHLSKDRRFFIYQRG